MTTEHQYDISDDEKVTPVMVYTDSNMFWGDVITKQAIRVGGWLRTDFAPRYLELRNAQMLIFGGGTPRTMNYDEIHFPLDSIMGFHVMPDMEQPLYYDPSEKNRVMQPVTVMIGLFRFGGHVRISTVSSVAKTLDVAKEPFLSLFEVEVTHPQLPDGGVVKVPYAVVRRNVSVFAVDYSQEAKL